MTPRERRAFLLYRLLARFAEILPVRGIRVIAKVAGVVGPRINPAKAALVRSNLRRVMETEPTDADVRATYSSYVRYWLQAFRLPIVPRDYLDHIVGSEGFEHIEAARAAGKGIIFALPHVGNWDVVGSWLTTRGIPLLVVAEHLHPQELHQWFEDFRSSVGMRVAVNGPGVATTLSRALHDNDAIALLCDRDVDGSGGRYEFFGEETQLPKGPALLALRTGATLLPVACYETPAGFVAWVDQPVPVERTDARLSDDVDRVTNDLTRRIEALIRREPTQWHLFQPNWPSDRAK
jgi:phosphatidylinositol dimannoside acyltransferase